MSILAKHMLIHFCSCSRPEEEVFSGLFSGEHHRQHKRNAQDFGIGESDRGDKDGEHYVLS
jgi:hypothetical protein